MGLLSEFKAFISRGNVIDLAVGVIIGAAFGKIVSSLVENLIGPVLGLIMGRLDLSDLAVRIAESEGGEPVLLRYGAFLQTCIDFLITAAAIFFLIKAVNTFRKALEKEKEAASAAPAEPPAQEKLLAEIRDLLKQGRS